MTLEILRFVDEEKLFSKSFVSGNILLTNVADWSKHGPTSICSWIWCWLRFVVNMPGVSNSEWSVRMHHQFCFVVLQWSGHYVAQKHNTVQLSSLPKYAICQQGSQQYSNQSTAGIWFRTKYESWILNKKFDKSKVKMALMDLPKEWRYLWYSICHWPHIKSQQDNAKVHGWCSAQSFDPSEMLVKYLIRSKKHYRPEHKEF